MAALIMLTACATPERISTVKEFTAAGKPLRESTTREVGYQLWVGERHDTVTTSTINTEIGKRTLGVVGGSVAGAAIGAAAGNPAAGAVVGTVAGGIGEALDSKSSK